MRVCNGKYVCGVFWTSESQLTALDERWKVTRKLIMSKRRRGNSERISFKFSADKRRGNEPEVIVGDCANYFRPPKMSTRTEPNRRRRKTATKKKK